MTNSVKCHLFMKRTFAVRTFAVVWLSFIVIVNTVAVLGDGAHHQQQQQQQLKQEARKLFGGYRITPKHCHPSNRVWRSNDNDTRPTAICMFNHECAQRGGEVVGACMDGFLFGACCQVPNTLDVEHTLINDAQNAHYHQHYQQKWQEQHYEIVHAENASRPDNNNNNHIQSTNEDLEDAKFDLTSHTQNDMAGAYPSSPSIMQIHKDSVKIPDTPTKASFLQDDLVMQAINTLSTRIVQDRVSSFTTELPTKIHINSNSYQHQESNTLTDTIKSPGETKNQFYIQHNNQSPTDLEYKQTFTKPNTTQPTLSQYNESTFKDPYVLIHTLTNTDNTKKPFPATTISSITTHANAIETIIQQLNGSNQPGPSYTILEQQHTSTYNQMDGITSTNSPIKLSALSSLEEEQTVPSSNYNDYNTSYNHETFEFNKMPSLGIAYPVDVSYIQEEDPIFINNGVNGSSALLQKISTDKTFTNNIKKEEQQQQQQQQLLEYQAVHNEMNENLNHQTVTIIKVPLDHYSNETPKPLHSQTDASKIQALPTNNILPSINKNQGTLETYAIEGSSPLDKEPYKVQQPVIIVTGPTNGALSTNNITKPLDNYASLITSQSYNPSPVLPNEVLVSSPTTLVQEPLTGYTTIFPTPNKFKPTYDVIKKPINPSSTSTTTPASILITQLSDNKKPFATITKVTKKPNQTNPSLLHGSHISTTTQQSSYEKPDKLTATSYLTTAAPTANINYHYNHVPPLIIANDKLDSLGLLATDQMQQALERPSSSQETYQEPVYLNSVAPLKIQAAKPEQAVNLVKIPTTTETVYPPSPTVHITPKPTKQQILVQNMPASYKPLLNRIPAPVVVGMVGSNTNDFDDPGYYAAADNLKPTTEFVGPNDDKPAFPGYYGPTPIYPAFHVPNEKDNFAIEEETNTSPNDFVNFPPVRNPNLNMTGTLRPATNDFEPSTPTFIEDNVLKNKMNTLVSKIVESLQDNFEVLADMIDDASYVRPPSVVSNSITTQKPIQKSTIKVTTNRPRTSTKKPPTRLTTKSPIRRTTTTRKPNTSTKRVVVRPITSTTRKPNSRKPTKKVTTTTAAVPIEADENDTDAEEEEEEDPSANEVDGTHVGAGSRKFQCGMRHQLKSGRIVGGKGSTFGSYPWQVLVRESTWLGLFTKNKCGGVLITNRYVITAAHCQPGFLASLVAVMGEFDISGDTESKRAITKNVKRVIVHRNYDPATFENDIALLELDTPVHFDTHIIPICMPSDKADFTGRMATVTGWGRLKYGGGVPSVLQEVQVPIIENSVCQEMFHTAGHNKRILNSFLCAGYANGQKDSCEGDSGGPLVLKRSDGRYELAGTVSHGIKCAAPYLPGVYMRTTFYKPWLRTITGVK